MQDDPAFAQKALQAGALAFVLKEAADEELLEAIRLAVAGHSYLAPQLGARLATMPEHPHAPSDNLSARELEVLRLIALGHTNNEIAEQLFVSTRTVETHRAHIQRKIDRTSRAGLVRYALDHGLLTV
jgi:two-component system response regulator NreC